MSLELNQEPSDLERVVKARCFHCKNEKGTELTLKHCLIKRTRNGKQQLSGMCSVCTNKVCTFIPRDSTVETAPPEPDA